MKKFYIVFLLLFINICIINNTVNVKADAPEGYDKTYYVRINIAFGVINVYEKDNSGNYSKIAIALPCSLPDNIEEYKDTTAIISMMKATIAMSKTIQPLLPRGFLGSN